MTALRKKVIILFIYFLEDPPPPPPYKFLDPRLDEGQTCEMDH
jgi:hypothetical protein